MKLTIILPCYNEEDNIPYIEKELFNILDKLGLEYEIIFVDDGSKDKTYQKIVELSKRNKRIIICKHKKNMGLGAAIQTGIKKARSDLLVTLDSDLTFHPKQIEDLLNAFDKNKVDCVIGSPTLKGYDKSIPIYRIFLSKTVNLMYDILLGKRITSVSPIFRLYKTNQLKKLKLESNGFDINAEILAKLLIQKKKVIEIPAKLTVRKYGVSKINNIREIKNHIKLMYKIIKWKLFRI